MYNTTNKDTHTSEAHNREIFCNIVQDKDDEGRTE